MKLAFVFIGCFVGVAVAELYRPFYLNEILRQHAKRISEFNDKSAQFNNFNNNNPEEDDYEISPTARQTSQPLIQQFHHNDNVNQFYYPVSPTFLPGQTSGRDDDDYFSSISSRRKNPFRLKVRPHVDLNGRFLFFNPFQNVFFPSNLYSYLNSRSSSVYSTTTSIIVLNSTLSTTLIAPCIPPASFSTLNNIAQTNACRRKRDLNQLLSADDDVVGPDYYPSTIDQ